MGTAATKVMIVDDDADFRGVMRDFLETENFEVFEAPDGIEAIEQARRHRPELMLLDIMMPRMNGYDVCRALRQDNDTSGISVIILSVKNSLSDKLCGYVAGAQRYLPKPFDWRELKDCIHTVLRQRQSLPFQYTQEFHVPENGKH